MRQLSVSVEAPNFTDVKLITGESCYKELKDKSFHIDEGYSLTF